MAATNICRVSRVHPCVTRTYSIYWLTVGDVFRWLRGLYWENFIGITSILKFINSWIIAQYGMTRVEVENMMDND
jgi:hypothetical protein